MRFSQRIGKVPKTKKIQIIDLDLETKYQLWNVIKLRVVDFLFEEEVRRGLRKSKQIVILLWHSFFKLDLDSRSGNIYQDYKLMKQKLFSGEWFVFYDFIECLTSILEDLKLIEVKKDFVESINVVLEQEFSAFRIINGIVVPISNEIEIKEIDESISLIPQYSSISAANMHLNLAMEKLSSKENPDYRNSIKESISAVETVCRVITNESTLGKALSKLESKNVFIDQQLKIGFERIYSYTNGESGIRHAMLEGDKTPDFEEAKYMIVSCSAFINYIIGKCIKSKVDF